MTENRYQPVPETNGRGTQDSASPSRCSAGVRRFRGAGALGILVLLCAVAGTIGYRVSEHSRLTAGDPGLRQFADARLLVEQGKLLDAAGKYVDSALGEGSHASAAREQLEGLLREVLNGTDADLRRQAARFLMRMPPRFHEPEPLLVDVVHLSSVQAERAAREGDTATADELLSCAAWFARERGQRETFHARRVAILQPLLAATPADLDLRVRLALVHEELGNLDAVSALLHPWRDALGGGEGARMLGRMDAQAGRVDSAIGLLEGYLKPRMPAFQQAAAENEALTTAMSERWFHFLNDGRAGNAIYEEIRSASGDAERAAIARRWIDARMEQDPGLVRARQLLSDFDPLVSAAMELGFLQLSRARMETDPGRRQQALEIAEETLLSVRMAAGESDDYRLYLGQVLFWLGRRVEAEAHFDAFLDAHRHSHDALAALSVTVRELGDFARCRNYLEEAYRAAPDSGQRQALARQRAAAAVDVDDRVLWLRKCDPDDREVAAALHSAQGEQALEQGDNQEAAGHLRAAIGAYTSLPHSAANCNNGGGAACALFRLTGNLDDHAQGTSMLLAAAELTPGDSIVLANAGHHLIEGVALQMLAKRVNLQAVARFLDFSSLGFLYDDEAGRARICAQLTNDRQYRKGLGLLLKATQLAPDNFEASALLADYLIFTGDHEGLENLALRTAGVAMNPDAVRGPAGDAKKQGIRNQAMSRRLCAMAAALLENPDFCAGDLDFALTASLHAALVLQMGASGDAPASMDQCLSLMREARRRHPSSATGSVLIAVLMALGLERAADSHHEIAELRSGISGVTDGHTAAVFLLERGGIAAALLAQQPLVAEALELLKEQHRRFPDHPDITDWATFRHVEPEHAGVLARRLIEDTHSQTCANVRLRAAPAAMRHLLQAFWRSRLHGDPLQERTFYRRACEAGLTMPAEESPLLKH